MSGNEAGEGGRVTQLERNKYFYGKLMTVRDFETEQRYFNEKRHLLNRLIHGVGIVCGLEVTAPKIEGGILKLKLSPGLALDCCGHEIIVGDEFHEKELDVRGRVSEGLNYVYLKYKECEKESVPVLANASSCEEACCYNRVEEIFELVLDEPSVTGAGESTLKSALEYYEEHLRVCPGCDCEDAKVLLAVIDKSGEALTINGAKTNDYRALVYNNPMLYELLSSHLLDFNNPHHVTAQQTEALQSIEGLSNPGGNIDLVEDNAITITTKTQPGADPEIIIGETHSEKKNNPHKVTALQVGALVSIDGVSNPGGDVDLVEGDHITITPDTVNKSITIGSTAGVEPATSVSSVQTSKNVGGSEKYAREDHVHNLANNIVAFQNLTKAFQLQLETVFQYLRERALKCTVVNFKEVGKRFDNKAAVELSSFAKKAVDERVYEDEKSFGKVIREGLELEKAIAKELKELATKESFDDFTASLKELEKALNAKEPLRVAPAQDEVCFYALLLERRERIGKVDFSPVIDAKVSEKFTPEVVSSMDRETKSELTTTKAAVILNEVYRNPDIKIEELAERAGMDVKSVESTVLILARGNILSGTDTKGYRLTL
ncbi:MAG: hypothetical protein EFT35_00425 [Methanophagales archaeon ANME-1-THS]|nr:MAG: hypothetical protein EFT35_00425 [Methanophagales archaeon ANME-1-THS]